MTKPFDPTDNKFARARAATRRARHLWAGAPPLGVSTSLKHCRVAVDEYRAGMLPFRLVEKRESAMHIVKCA